MAFSIFTDGGLFVPQSPHKIVERPPFVHPGTCEVHKMPKDFWCYDDETAVCGGCRISSHLNHDVVRITEKNEEELREFYTAVDETVDLVDEMKKTTKAIQDKTKSVQSEYDLLISQVGLFLSYQNFSVMFKLNYIDAPLFWGFARRFSC